MAMDAQPDDPKREQEREDLLRIMDTAWGRRFVWRLLEQAGVYRLSFAGDQTHLTSFREGQRNMGLRLILELHEVCPDKYAEMLRENSEREHE